MTNPTSRTIITGASSGIGAEIARQLASRGGKLALVARRAEKLEAVAAECRAKGGTVLTVEADVGSAEDCKRLVGESVKWLGGLDHLLLNAGISQFGKFESWSSPEIADQLMQVNYMGAVRTSWHALPHLKAAKGLITVVSSLQGKAGFPYSAGYSASKHALHGFFDALRSELINEGVDVTMVCPGPVESNINDRRPDGAPGVMAVDDCARRIIAAMDRRQRELIMTFGGKAAVLLRPFAPNLIDRIIRRKLSDFYES